MTDVVYYMLTEGSMTEAQAVVDLVEHISIQEMAIEFRREVVVKAKRKLSSSLTSEHL